MPDGEESLVLPLVVGGVSLIPGVGEAAVLAALTAAGITAVAQSGLVQDIISYLSAQGAQAALSGATDTLTAQQNFTIEQNNALAAASQQATQAEIQRAIVASQIEQDKKDDFAIKSVDIINTATSEADLTAKLAQLSVVSVLSPELKDDLISGATDIYHTNEVAKAKAAADAAAKAKAAADQAAALTGKVATGTGLADLSVPLTGAALASIAGVLATTFSQASHSQGLSCMGTTGQTLLDKVMVGALPALLPVAFAFNPQLQQFAQGLAAEAIDKLYSPLESMAPITPDKAPGVGVNLLLQAVMMGVGAHLTSIAAEASAPLKTMGLGYLSAFLADMAGFSRIAGAYQGMMIQWGLAQPMRYWALEKFRPMIPREGDLLELYGHQAIDERTYLKNMGYHGYPDEWAKKLEDLATRPLSPMLFRYLGEAGMLDPVIIDRELKEARYHPETIPYLKKWLDQVSAGELKGTFSSQVLYAYREGNIEDADLTDQLTNLGYDEKQITRAVYAAHLDLANEMAKDLTTFFTGQFNAGLINPDELEMRLSTVIRNPTVRAIKIAQADLKLKAKREAKVTAAAESETTKLRTQYINYYIELYRDGALPAGRLAAAIESTGVSPQLASITAELEILKHPLIV